MSAGTILQMLRLEGVEAPDRAIALGRTAQVKWAIPLLKVN